MTIDFTPWLDWLDDQYQPMLDKTIELAPESVTIYQMELPYNTVFSRETNGRGKASVADWPTKRAWVAAAFDAAREGEEAQQ